MEKSFDMWSPYKELLVTVEAVLSRPEGNVPPKFVELLKRHKQNFINLLKNPPKNAKSRDELKKGTTEGITLPDVGHQILSKDLVDEALILSDMYNLNEIMALDLLCIAQAQMPYHPGLTRGLVAVILYYDGRKSLVLALHSLVAARKGFNFSSNCSEEVSDFVTAYTDELMEDGLISKLLTLVDTLDLYKEIELLQQNRALGGPKHHKQVIDLFNSIKQNVAFTIFIWSAQCGLPKDPTLKLIHLLKRTKIQEESTGGIDNVTLTLEMALLYALDLSILQRHEDNEEIVKKYPLLADKTFCTTLIRELNNTSSWECKGLGALTSLAWSITLSIFKTLPQHSNDNYEDEEAAIDAAIKSKVFKFLNRTFYENSLIYQEEFFTRRLHQLLTDFIVLMPSKVAELKKKGEESSRMTQMYAQQGLEAPSDLSHDFEDLLLAVANLYAKDPYKLELCLEYWCPPDSQSNYRYQSRQVSLFRFVKMSGETIPSLFFVPYLKMLCSLSNSPHSACFAYKLLRQDGQSLVSSTISWDHFFNSLSRYFSNLRQEHPPANDTVYRHRNYPKGITPQEVQGLHSVLSVIRMVAEQDEFSRVALCENPNWSPLTVLLGLVSCSVPILLKADLLTTLAALAKTPSTAATLWHNLEASQILTTIPSTSSYTPRGIKTELDEIESRNEEFPLTRALLHLLDVLTDVPVPRLLGAGCRTPGFDPYLHFIIDSVFLKFNNRSYKNPEEKWQVATSCLKLLVKFLKQYEPRSEDFFGVRVEAPGGGTTPINPPPGYHLMISLNNKSELLRLVLHLIDEGVQRLDTYSTFPGKEALEKSNLYCLELLDVALSLQTKFLSLVTNAGASLLLIGLSKLLLGVNPRSGKTDHMLNITKYVVYNEWLPKHSYHSVRILAFIASQPSTQIHLVGLFTSTPTLKIEIRHGFVECLEAEDDEENPDDEDDFGIRSKTKEIILKLLQQSLNLSSPNIALYLIGFDLNKDCKKMIFQQPGILQTPRTILHSLLRMLNDGIKARTGNFTVVPKSKLLEIGYCLLYQLCSNSKTSEPILRFLRCCHDFLPRHVACLPFKPHKNSSERNQMAWLLKIVAIELKICAANKQNSQLQNLVNLLIGDQSEEDGRSMVDEDDIVNHNAFDPRVLDPDFSQSLNSSTSGQKRNDQRFLRILNLINFSIEYIHTPDWEFFDSSEIETILTRCEVQVNQALKLVDVKVLHKILTDELAAIQGSSTASQRQLILNEIKDVCEYALAKNKLKTKATATLHLMEAWRQVTEIIFAVTPNETLQNDYRQELIIDTLHILLYKVIAAENVVPEIASLSSGVIMILLVNLRQCQALEHRESRDSATRRNEDTGEITIMLSTLQANSNTLKNIFCGILQWIINSGTASQKLRANLYGSLLNFLYITCVDVNEDGEEDFEDGDSLYTTRLDNSRYRLPSDSENVLRKVILKVISHFGEGLADALCHDCTRGHDVCRMLALSCMDVLIELDPFTSWVGFLSARGYLQHLIDSLLESDDELVEICANDRVSTLRPLYVYESKLVLLSRIASTRDGAILLIEQNAINCLSSMKVFDFHPKPLLPHELKIETDFVPSQSERFQQVLFPALNLFDTIVTSLGTENHSSNEAIVHFLLCHGDTVASILRNASPRSSLGSLKEVARLTSVIARSSEIGQLEDAVQFFDVNRRHGAHSPYLLKTLMLDLIQRFVITEELIQDIWGNSSLSSKVENPAFFESQTDEKIETILQISQIACNLLVHVRNAISSKDKIDYRATEPVFWPGLIDQQTIDGRSGGRGNGENPLLGHIVQQLTECVNYYHRESSIISQLNRKLSAVPNMTGSELQQFLPDSPMSNDMNSVKEARFSASKVIRKRLDQKTLELEHCSFLIENCLYIIWSHLDFFMLRALPKPKQGFDFDLNKSVLASTISNKDTSLMSVTCQDITILKNGLISIFNESFSKKLIATKEDSEKENKEFLTALLRRIKRLIQFVPVK
ncbi:conserved hypothetical protein [Pediculus humanus corporis]|uniref:Nuclear pore complex protein Nup205 n=1 Tax=Pediculus humanus subsp. corporis TaxID=121224 RepID=E0W0N8_PEDHC|nr:uncharacterized protein Phum_PHUM561100 [Pediculus humanus corporis]EEB19194.1 conserved hypothetical protein [Pediculus humanus corporis]